MPLATKNGSLIVKSGSLAETCNCCSANCTSCQSGLYPNTINASVRMTVNDGTTTFAVTLKKLFSTTHPSNGANIGLCAEYLYSIGAGANPGEVGYEPAEPPRISFTYQDIGPPAQINLSINFRMSLSFGGDFFRPDGSATVVPRGSALFCFGFQNVGGLVWNLFNVGGSYSSSASPLCYLDYAGVSNLAIKAGTDFKKYPGTFSMSITGVS